MRVSVAQIGNSKGIRIPQSILKQCEIEDEVDLDVQDKTIVLRPIHKKTYNMTFENLGEMEDLEIQLLLKKIDVTTLAISLVTADEVAKERVFKNLSENAYDVVCDLINKYSTMDAKQLIIEMHRARIDNVLSEI
jgi:antitoxin MazE